MSFLILKMAADNWRKTGNILCTNDIMKIMFRRDGKPPSLFLRLLGQVCNDILTLRQWSFFYYLMV